MPFCDYCEYEQAGVSNDIGALYCSNCGKTIGEEHFSDEPTFNKGPGGVNTIQGTLTRIRQNESNSLLVSRRRGEDQIRMLISSLKIDDTIEHQANCFYGIAAHRGFTKKHKIDHVAAACLYVACRAKEKPYLLIDFSEKLAVSVYVLGAVFLQLCQLLLLDDHPIVQKPVDPSLFIHKFAEGLVAKLDEDTVPKKDVVNRISKTALHVIASMKRDWMQTGRKPSGLCGAAIYVAALMNRIRFTKSEVMTVVHTCEATLMKRLFEFGKTESGCLTMTVVHTCEATLMKRLFEFGKTESGCLTIDEFNQRAEDFEREQPNGCTNGSDILCEHENEEVHAHGLCKECFDERPESEVAQDASRKINGPSTECISLEYTLGKEHHITSGQGNNIKMNETEKLAEPQFNYNYPVGNKESEDLTNDETEGLSDIKDAEVECYLNSKEEARYKKIIWEQVNKEYLEEQALKEAAKAASYSGMAEGTYEIQEAQKLARKQKRQQRASDAKNAVPARTAAEAIVSTLNKKRLKINKEALQQLFGEDDRELASKDPEDGVSAAGVDASDEQEEADNINNYDEVDHDYQEEADNNIYNYDEVDQDYQEHGPDTYYNNDLENGAYYDGNVEEPYNYHHEDDGDYY